MGRQELVRSVCQGRVSVRVLQTFELHVGGASVALPMNVQRVIAFLAVNERPQLRVTLASKMWMDTTEDRATANLRTTLWKARHALGKSLVADGCYVALAADVAIDLRDAAAQARRLVSQDARLGQDDDATPLVGELLPDWDEDWIMFERERYRQLRIHALESMCRLFSECGRNGEAIDAGVAAVAAEPLRESAQRALIRAYLREGNLCEARRQYHEYRELLWDALGVEPSRALRSLVGLAAAAG